MAEQNPPETTSVYESSNVANSTNQPILHSPYYRAGGRNRGSNASENDRKWTELSGGVAWSIVFSLAAIIMSLCSLCRSRERVLGFDYLGVIVGILALLVTFLVAWQIVQTIVSKEQLRNIQKMVHDQTKHSIHLNLHNVFWSHGITLYNQGNHKIALDYFIRSLDNAYKCDFETIKVNSIVKKIKDTLRYIDENEKWLNPDDLCFYADALSNSNHIEAENIIERLRGQINNDSPSQSEIWNNTTSIGPKSKEIWD